LLSVCRHWPRVLQLPVRVVFQLHAAGPPIQGLPHQEESKHIDMLHLWRNRSQLEGACLPVTTLAITRNLLELYRHAKDMTPKVPTCSVRFDACPATVLATPYVCRLALHVVVVNSVNWAELYSVAGAYGLGIVLL
jgi:hypothetical protein